MSPVHKKLPPEKFKKVLYRARREEDILGAAERVFAHRGYHATSMNDVAREAGYAVGSLYKFFESKEALFQRLVAVRLASLGRKLDAALDRSKSIAQQLEALALVKARHAVHDRAFVSIFVSTIPGDLDTLGLELPAAVDYAERTHAALLELIELGIKNGEITRTLPPRVIALAYTAMVRAHVLDLVARAEDDLDEGIVRELVRAFVRGMAPVKRPSSRREAAF